MSTLAIDGSDRFPPGRLPSALRFADLGALVIALGVFLVVGLPMLGYAVAAAAWLCAFGIQLAADRHAARALARRDRRSAVAGLAAATLGRVWLVVLAILLVGLADRDSGLAAAVLAAVLVTVHLVALALRRMLSPTGER